MTTEPLLAPIDAVTVYTDRALITRRGKIQLENGARELKIENLPTTLDVDSIRARGSGAVAVKILGVESRVVFSTQENHQAARQTQQALDAATDEGAALAREEETLSQRLANIESLAENATVRYAKTLSQGQASLGAAGELLDWIQAQTQTAHRQRAELEGKKRDNAARQIALQNELQQWKGGRQKQTQTITVAIEASSIGEWELEVSYQVMGASWKPLYDARVRLQIPTVPESEIAGELQLAYLASITQNSGEDWTSAAITLSTARPSLGSLPPKLAPIYVDTPRNVAFGGSAKMMRSRALADDDEVNVEEFIPQLSAPAMAASAPAPELIEAEIESANISSEGATVTFELPRRLNVPSDGQPHRAQIAQLEFPCKLDYFAVPRRGECAYLRATILNRGEALLTGEANVFRDDTFVGKTTVESVAPDEEWKIFLGPDEQVKTKRELVRREVDKNLIGNVRRQHFGHQIQIENLKSHRIALEISDQIPVSRHEQIKVKLPQADPPPRADEMGILEWNLTLQAREKRALTYECVVESPRDMTVTGITD